MTIKWTAPDAMGYVGRMACSILLVLIHDQHDGWPQNYVAMLGEWDFGHKGCQMGILRELDYHPSSRLGAPERGHWTGSPVLLKGSNTITVMPEMGAA